MFKLKNIQWNVPNILSAYRLASFPFLLVFCFLKYEKLFATLLCINLVTDIADGYIARKFKLETPEGAVLDSMADLGSYILALCGVLIFHHYIWADSIWLKLFLALYILSTIVPFIKYGRPVAGLHLWSAKVAGYVQGVFFFTLFAYKFIQPLFIGAMFIGYYSLIEGLFINMHAKEAQLNAKSIFHYLKRSKHGGH
jgi:cardiolipin synthase (CMP-forming)